MISLPLLRESTPAGPAQASPPLAGQASHCMLKLQRRMSPVPAWALAVALTLLSAAAWAAAHHLN
jgi:hypothetical protein